MNVFFSRVAVPIALVCMLAVPGFAGPRQRSPSAVAEPPPPTVDISAVRDKLKVLHDGKNHYIALVPFGETWTHLYYGDGKNFYLQKVLGGGGEAGKSFSRTFWEPRVKDRWQAAIDFRDDRYSVQCEDRQTTLQVLDADATRAMVQAAKFSDPLWSRRAYALARDQAGTYYYVDTGKRPGTDKAFRLHSGPRGKLQQMPMLNVVSDSAGDIFATKTGKLRLVLDRTDSVWIDGKREVKLTSLPVEDNGRMIYTDLGVYLGQRLGTPCDDL